MPGWQHLVAWAVVETFIAALRQVSVRSSPASVDDQVRTQLAARGYVDVHPLRQEPVPSLPRWYGRRAGQPASASVFGAQTDLGQQVEITTVTFEDGSVSLGEPRLVRATSPVGATRRLSGLMTLSTRRY